MGFLQFVDFQIPEEVIEAVSTIDETELIERLQFFNGQRLFAADLQGLEASNRKLRWLHNRSLHQPGVGNGFSVHGEKGERQITIGAGYAIDSRGREIIQTRTETLPIPPVSGNNGKPIFFDLTVAYPDDSALEESETREGVCSANGVVRLQEMPVFCWVELEGDNLVPKKTKLKLDLEKCLRIRLARIEVLNCQLNSRVSIAVRQSARPAQTPYIAAGTDSIQRLDSLNEVPGLQSLFDFKSSSPRMITGTVDTSQAEFLTIPEYTAHIVGPRKLVLNADPPVEVMIVDQFHMTNAKINSFEFFDFVLLFSLDGQSLNTVDVQDTDESGNPSTIMRSEAVEKQLKNSWQLVWMGVEA